MSTAQKLSAPRERPILFSSAMVRAILDGRKTQTRRVVKPKDVTAAITRGLMGGTGPAFGPCPYGGTGDMLWVRETWGPAYSGPLVPESPGALHYRASQDWEPFGKWRPSIHMPRWASRITLEVTGVRVERLQDISEEDAKAEGVAASELVTMRDGSPCYTTPFQQLWRSIHGIDNPAAWDANPWVWVVAFKRVKP